MAALNAANLGFLKMYDTQKVFISLIEVRSNTGYNYNINHYIYIFFNWNVCVGKDIQGMLRKWDIGQYFYCHFKTSDPLP